MRVTLEKYLMYIDGEWVEASSGEYFSVENPAMEEVFAEAPSAYRAFRFNMLSIELCCIFGFMGPH
ncbi:MAG: hypothetical protein QXI18_01090 [Nitrososphaerota archaeon]